MVDITRSLQVVKFNQSDVRHIMTTGERKTMFWGWEHGGLRGYIPKISRHDFKKARIMLRAAALQGTLNRTFVHLQQTPVVSTAAFSNKKSDHIINGYHYLFRAWSCTILVYRLDEYVALGTVRQ